MPDLNIRGIDAGMMRGLKVGAAQAGETLREYVIRVLGDSLESGRSSRLASGDQTGETPEKSKGREVREVPREVRELTYERESEDTRPGE